MLSGFQVISLRFVGSILPHSSRDESAATRALIHLITDFNFFFLFIYDFIFLCLASSRGNTCSVAILFEADR